MRVIICGAGIAGLSLACSLARSGWEVLVLELAPLRRSDGFMIDFFGSGYDAAELMGLLPKLDRIRYHPRRLVYLDEDGHQSAAIPYELFERLQKGRLMSFMRGDLEDVLFKSLPKSVEVRFNVSVLDVMEEGSAVRAELTNGVCEYADLLVGADGIHSRIRKLWFGEDDQFVRYLGFHTAAFVLEDQLAARGMDQDFTNLSAPGRNVGIYPMPGNRIASFFVHRAASPQLPESPCTELRRIYGDLAGMVPRTLAFCSTASDFYYDRVDQVEMPRWSRGRVTLIGDSCCAASLLAGQGASIAMGAAYVLADELLHARAVEEALFRYEERVKPVVTKKQRVGRSLANWIVPATSFRISVRNMILNLSRFSAFSRLVEPIFAAGKESIVRPTT